MNTLLRWCLVGAVLYSAALAAQAPADADLQAVEQDIEGLLESNDLVIDGVDILGQDIVTDVYQGNEFRPYWSDTDNIRKLVALIGQAPEHGLIASDYNFDRIIAILAEREGDPSDLIDAESDILLTDTLLLYGYHRRLGKVKASSLDPDVNYKRQAFREQHPSETLQQLLEAPSLQAYIDVAAPAGPYYRAIQQGLQRFRQLAAEGGWPQVPEGPTLRKGDVDPRVAVIRTRLSITSDLPADADDGSEFFDDTLEQGVVAFQKRHALGADGVVGAKTTAAMNVPVERRIDQLRLSLERIRWVNQEAVQTFVAVNIASFYAYFFRDGEMVWSARAMVGKDYRRTPIFRGDIRYMEFNPTWTIPPTILRNDTLPAIRRDPNYLASNNIRVIDSSGNFVDPVTIDWSQYRTSIPYTLRQDPGPNNALGTVKFIFPNKHAVFLHDTPHRELFSRPERAFSSGCIRIQHPLELAALLLDDNRYPESALQSIVNSRQTQRINLESPVPVIIAYLTAGVDEHGHITFYRDIYDKDAEVLEALNGPVVFEPPMLSEAR